MGGGGVAERPRAPSDLAGSKRHLTFPALKEYDSREADGEKGESGEGRGRSKRQKAPHQNS